MGNTDGSIKNVPGKVLAIFRKLSSSEDANDKLSPPKILLHSCHGMQQKENSLSIKEKAQQLKTNAISECWQLECTENQKHGIVPLLRETLFGTVQSTAFVLESNCNIVERYDNRKQLVWLIWNRDNWSIGFYNK